ncbi:metallophosphoesterase [Halolamina sediminis]|uniref:metallophosphoesterase n=1 Tax=Halolamina sediminis TaxID=1480675 RepID=UPI0006B5B051|nr:metallophosphoesterase [Halolamina sediminis]
MSRYLISDHHFGHANIIEYCDRPFDSPGAMDSAMLDAHYETVPPDAVLVHLGDVAMDMQDGRETIERFNQLDGDLLVRGNHDVGLDPDDAPFPVVDATVLDHGERTFYCTHRPEDVPEDWDGWVIHGHHHDNNPDTHPFVAADARRVNVSAELLDYRPVRLDGLTALLDRCGSTERLRDAAAAESRFEIDLR